MLATRTRALLRLRQGGRPAGTQFADKRVAVQSEGGRVRLRTIVTTVRVGGQRKRRQFGIAGRAPKVVILYDVDAQGAGRGGAGR